MNVNIIQDRVNYIDQNQRYFFIRTNGGINYDTFLEHNFIAIGWNLVTLVDLSNPVGILKDKIGRVINDQRRLDNHPLIDLNSKKGKSKVTSVYNKLNLFNDLNRGDIIVMPSYRSNNLAFGIIQDERIYSNNIQLGSCNFHKRRNVRWLENKTMFELDPKFYQIKSNRHSISDISKYAEYIDFVTNTLYLKGESGYYVLNIRTNEEINVSSLLNLIKEVQDITIDINEHFRLNENIETNSIKLTLHSPGTVTFKLPSRVAVLFGLTITLATCDPANVNVPDTEKNETIQFVNTPQHKTKIDSLINTLDQLGANQDQRNTFR